VVAQSGGKVVLTNLPLTNPALRGGDEKT